MKIRSHVFKKGNFLLDKLVLKDTRYMSGREEQGEKTALAIIYREHIPPRVIQIFKQSFPEKRNTRKLYATHFLTLIFGDGCGRRGNGLLYMGDL